MSELFWFLSGAVSGVVAFCVWAVWHGQRLKARLLEAHGASLSVNRFLEKHQGTANHASSDVSFTFQNGQTARVQWPERES